MPIYEFECDSCKVITEKIYSINKKPELIQCPNCLDVARSIIGSGADRKEWNSYVDDNLGDNPVLVESREHRKELMKKAGLTDQYHHKPGMPGQWI